MTDDINTNTNPNVPTNELDHRRRVLQCVEELADLSKDVADRVRELRELGVPATDWMPILFSHGSPVVQSVGQQYGSFLAGAVDGFLDARAAGAGSRLQGVLAGLAGFVTRSASGSGMGAAPQLSAEATRMKALVARLFAEAPKMTDGAGKPDETQAPALQCHIMLKAGGSFQGALSVTPEGTLRLMAPNQINNKPVMVEHFFDYEQVADIAVFREVKTSEGSRIVTS